VIRVTHPDVDARASGFAASWEELHDPATPTRANALGGAPLAAMADAITGHPQYLLAALLAWVVLYLVYKIAWRRDFGLPVRRRMLTAGLHVERDQVAYVPFWWSDIQVQRALDDHWRRTMRKGFERRRSW
jgi:hypothetical protein